MFFGFRQLAAGLLMSLAALSSVQAQNLLQNGNFEQFDSVTAPWFWNFTWGGELITTDAPQGNVYARCATGSFYHTTGVYTQTDTVYEVSFLGRVSDWEAGDWPVVQLSWGDPQQWENVALIDSTPLAAGWRLFSHEFTGKDDTVAVVVGANGATLEVDDVQITALNARGANLLGEGNNYNPGFESADNGTWYWAAAYWNGSGYEAVTTDSHSGWRSLKVDEDTEWVNHAGSGVSALDAGKVYEFSFWAKAVGVTTGDWPRAGFTGSSQNWDQTFSADTDGWVQIEYLFTGQTQAIPFVQWNGAQTGGYLLVDDFAVREAANQAPQVASLACDPAQPVPYHEAQLSASVSDDGMPAPLDDALTLTWSVISGDPAAITFGNVNDANTTMVTTAQYADYVLRLTAFDGEYTTSATLNLQSVPAQLSWMQVE